MDSVLIFFGTISIQPHTFIMSQNVYVLIN